jgi:hypothetical protein
MGAPMADRPGANEPISLDKDPTGQQVVGLWKSTRGRFDGLYRKVEASRAIVNKDTITLSDRSDAPLTLPQRLMAVTMTNSLSSQYGMPELTRHGRPVATDKSDEIETVLKATLERSLSTPDVFGKATQDGSWAMAVLPAPLDVMRMPVYSEDGYSFDTEKRKKGDSGYSERDVGASQRAFDRDKEDFLAGQQYVTIDLIDPTDCAPILVRGTRGRRFEARGLMVRRLFAREDLLGAGYVCPALSHEAATLIPRGDRGNTRGRGGQLWLYTAYLTLWDEDEKELVPVVVYSVAGEDTQRRTHDLAKKSEEQGPALINLKKEYGISTPMWGWYCGMRTADPDPDKVPLPFLDAYTSLVLTLERLLAASVHHAERSSFHGSWVEPNENVPPEAYTETVDNQLRLKRFDAPLSGELVTAPGKVTPNQPQPLGPAATQMIAAMMQQLSLAPDPSEPAGSGASGYAMSLASGLIEAAHADIPRGVLECYQDAANWTLECIAAVMQRFGVPYVIDANEELPPDEPGDHRNVTQRYTLTERDLGGSYRVTAAWRQKPDPVNVTLTLDLWMKGAASLSDVQEARGETNSIYKIAEILYEKQVTTPGTPENLELSAYVARKRGETERAEQLELQAKALIQPQGTPTDAIAPEAQQMAQMIAGAGGGMGGAPGGGAPPSGVQTGVRSSISAATQGAIGGGPQARDALAAGEMGIRPATPNGIGGS